MEPDEVLTALLTNLPDDDREDMLSRIERARGEQLHRKLNPQKRRPRRRRNPETGELEPRDRSNPPCRADS